MPDKAKDKPAEVVAPATDPKPAKVLGTDKPWKPEPLPDDAPEGAVGRMGADGMYYDKDGAELPTKKRPAKES